MLNRIYTCASREKGNSLPHSYSISLPSSRSESFDVLYPLVRPVTSLALSATNCSKLRETGRAGLEYNTLTYNSLEVIQRLHIKIINLFSLNSKVKQFISKVRDQDSGCKFQASLRSSVYYHHKFF